MTTTQPFPPLLALAPRQGPDDEWRQLMCALGRQARSVRELVGLSQDQLADLAGVSQGSVSRFENGRGLATPLLVVLKLALALASTLGTLSPEVLGAKVTPFLELVDQLAPFWKRTDDRPMSITEDPELEDVVRLYRGASTTQRAVVLTLLRSFVC